MQALEGQEDGKIRMEVDTEKNQLLIRVTDNGPGIPSDLIEDIFVPFFTTKATGSGIGLSLSRQIIRMHGGELSGGFRRNPLPGEKTLAFQPGFLWPVKP